MILIPDIRPALSFHHRHDRNMNHISAASQRSQSDQSDVTAKSRTADGLDAEPEPAAEPFMMTKDDSYQRWQTDSGHQLEHVIHDKRWMHIFSSELVRLCSELVDALSDRLDRQVLNISVCWTDDAEMARHNSQFRQKPAPTNILSFPSGTEPEIGDLVISFDTVMHEAGQMDIPVEHHIAHLVVHGILHLLSMTILMMKIHQMESLETELLTAFDIADPYARSATDGQHHEHTERKLIWPFGGKPVSVREELTGLIETSISHPDTEFDNQESLLLKNMLGLRDITAQDVMVPRADIVAVDMNDGFHDVLQQMSNASHSRYPAFEEKMDETIGMLHIKDMMRHNLENSKADLKRLIRPVLFVAPTIRLLDLLQEMRLRRLHLALVVDEFGGIDGLITIEDLVEEIVGEIQDEHDQVEKPRFEIAPDGTAIADARFELEAFEALIGQQMLEGEERDEIDTLGGLVVTLAGQVPLRGEVIRHESGIIFEVLESDPRRLTLLRVRGANLAKDSLAPAQNPDSSEDNNAPLSLR